MRKIIIALALIVFVCFTSNSYAYQRDERMAFQEIETLMLKEDYSQVKSKCDRFLRDYRQSRLRNKVYDLREKAAKKVGSNFSGQVSSSGIASGKKLSRRGPEGYYVVQVGAFESYRNANKVKQSLKKQKFDAIIIKTKRNGKRLYKVRAGKFRNQENAESLLESLKKKGYSAEIIDG